MLLDGSLEGGRVGADDLADLLAVLEDEEGGHGADRVLLGGLGDLVDVDLEEARVGVVVRESVRVVLLVWLSCSCLVLSLHCCRHARSVSFLDLSSGSGGARGIRT